MLRKLASSGLVMLWVSLLVFAMDRYSKTWVMDNLHLHEPLSIFPFFDLTLAYNTGAAFSFLDSASGWQNWFLGSLAGLVCIIMLVWLSRLSSRDYAMSIGIALIFGGAIGNLCDRFIYGYVIDLLSFHWGDWYFAIFNIADSAICLGAFILFCTWLLKRN